MRAKVMKKVPRWGSRVAILAVLTRGGLTRKMAFM